MLGRSTLTATSSPSMVIAKCTCAIEAAATDCHVKSEKHSSILIPISCSIIVLTSISLKGGKLSCNFERSLANSSPSKSERVERAWPNLMKVGPSSCRALAKRSPGRPLALGLIKMCAVFIMPIGTPASFSTQRRSLCARVRTIPKMREIFFKDLSIVQLYTFIFYIFHAECIATIPQDKF